MSKCRIKEIVNFFDNENIYFAGGGTGALIDALKAIDCKGKKVILPVMTCPNVAIAVYTAGAQPVYIDIDEQTGNMDIKELAAKIDNETRAIIAVHSFGYPLAIDKIRKACPGITIIEDACQAYGGRLDTRPLGTLGDLGIISFGATKPVAVGRGAAIIINNPTLRDSIKSSLKANISRRIAALDTIKFALAKKMMIKEHNKLLKFAAGFFNLYNFNVTPDFYSTLHVQWQMFEKNIPALQSKLFALAELISHPKIKRLNYVGSDWLPWRYSFQIEDESFLRRLVRIGKINNVKLSRLYKPIVKYFDNDQDGLNKYPHALIWSKTTLNVIYNHQVEEIDNITANIRPVIEKTAEALARDDNYQR